MGHYFGWVVVSGSDWALFLVDGCRWGCMGHCFGWVGVNGGGWGGGGKIL